MEFINNLQLIQEVRKYPCLYDTKDPNYKDVENRRSTWELVCQAVYENAWDDFKQSQRKEATSDVQKRWKAIRDSFTKAYKILKTGNAGNGSGKKRKPYVYSNQMEFLIPFIHTRSYLQDSEDQDGCEDDDILIENTDSKPALSLLANSPEEMISQLTTQLPTTTQHGHREESQRLKRKAGDVPEIEPDKVANDSKNMDDDPDKMFLLSLLPAFKRIREAEKLDVQIEILQCLKRNLKS